MALQLHTSLHAFTLWGSHVQQDVLQEILGERLRGRGNSTVFGYRRDVRHGVPKWGGGGQRN